MNDGATGAELRPSSGPWSFFRRVRLLAGGQLVEDIDYYNRAREMMEILTASDSRDNETVEGFGFRWDEHAQPSEVAKFNGIAKGDRQTVLFKPLCGLFNQNKLLPLSYLQSLSLELELVDNPADPVVRSGGPTAIVGSGTVAANPYTDALNSASWHLENVQVKCDVVSLDTGLQNSYDQIVLSSKEIPIHYNTFSSQFQTITGQEEPFINVSRAATRLKSVFVSLDKNLTSGIRFGPGRKSWNEFFSPASENNISMHNNKSEDEFELQIQIGSKLFPEYPIRSHAEAYYQLRKALGVQSSKMHSFDISPQEYRDNRLVVAVDTEKMLGASFTGLNTRAGDLMTVRMKYKNITDARSADRVRIVLHSDNILQISASGVSVFD